jgi:precorrin-6A/cobalt-precorrin-6A reductase
MRSAAVDVVVTKDSGGEMAAAKLTAARELGLPVVMVDRPRTPSSVEVVTSVEAAVVWVGLDSVRSAASRRGGRNLAIGLDSVRSAASRRGGRNLAI